MSEHIVVKTVDRILQIQFNRPDKKNAITRAMYAAMADAITQAETNENIRVVLIAGTEGCFTSGNDIADFMQAPPTDETSPAFNFLSVISQAQKPLVAAVNGIAIGIGVTMLLHCDLVYAAAGARLRLPFVSLGVVPEAGSSYILPQLMGHRRAAELLLLGDFFDAEKARDVGIVNEVVNEGDLVALATEKAQALAAQPPSALRLTKSLIKQANSRAIKTTMAEEGRLFRDRLQSPEAHEAMQAFMERRKPDFSEFT